MHRYVRRVLLGVIDVALVAVLYRIGKWMEDVGYGNVSLMYLIVIAIAVLFVFVAYLSLARKTESWRGMRVFSVNLISSLCVALLIVGKLYDTRVLFELFPMLETIGEYAPLALLVVMALVALVILVLTRIYTDMGKRDIGATRKAGIVSTTAVRGDAVSSRDVKGDIAVGRNGEDANGRVSIGDSDASESRFEVSYKSRFWTGLGAVLLAVAVLAVSIWLCFSSDGLLKMNLDVSTDSGQAFVKSVALPIVIIVVVAIEVVLALFLLVGAVTIAFKGSRRLMGYSHARSETPDGSVVALVSLVVFLGVLGVLRWPESGLSAEMLFGPTVAQELAAKVVFAALILLGSAISVLLIYTVLNYAWKHSESLLPVARAIANSLVYYVALVFAQVLKYLFFFPDFLEVLIEGIPDEQSKED